MTHHHTEQSGAPGSGAERRFPTMQDNCRLRCACFGEVGYGSWRHPVSFSPVADRLPAARPGRRCPTLSLANHHCPAAQSANRSQPAVPRRGPFPAALRCAGSAAPRRKAVPQSCIVGSASPSRVVTDSANDTIPQFNSCITTKRTARFGRLGAGRWGNANRPIRVLVQKAVARHCALGQRICEV